MTRFEDRIAAHPIHERIADVRTRLEAVSDERIAELNQTDPADTISRIQLVSDLAESRLLGARAELVSERTLADLQNAFDHLSNQLVPLIDSNDVGMLVPIDGAVDELIDRINTGLPTSPIADSEEAHEAASALAVRVSEVLQSASTTADSIDQRLDADRAALDQRVAAIQESLDARAAAVEQKSNELEGQLNQLQADTSSTLANLQSSFDQAENERKAIAEQSRSSLDQRLEEVIDAANTERTAELERIKEASEAQVNAIKTDSRSLVEQLTQYRDEAAQLVDLVSTSATAGAFQNEATEQRDQADRWRNWAIGLGMAAGLVAVVAVIVRTSGKLDPELLVVKALAAAAFTALAGYAASQSKHHRDREVKAKRLELELAAFGPFSESLEQGDQTDARKKYIDRIFVGNQSTSDGEPSISESQVSLIGQLANLLNR